MRIILIAVGDELLVGQTLDTNSHWIARRLAKEGVPLARLIWSSDSPADLKQNLRTAWEECDILVLTGGLGPTEDDRTRPLLASFFDDVLEWREEIAESIKARYEKVGRTAAPGWESMAYFPALAKPLPNDHGAAVGIHYRSGEKSLFALPGVPTEMMPMFEDAILPVVQAGKSSITCFRHFRTCGAGESQLAALIGDSGLYSPVGIAYLPNLDQGVAIRLTASGKNEREVHSVLDRAAEKVGEAIDEFIYSYEDTSIEDVIVKSLRIRKQTIALAESCTGGMIASRLISIPGASDPVKAGLITYADAAKTEFLGVRPEVILANGAVSEPVAAAMAEGARIRVGCDYGLSVTGIAGPGGATKTKPIGLTYVGLASKNGTQVREFRFAGDRDENRRRSAHAALVMLWQELSQR